VAADLSLVEVLDLLRAHESPPRELVPVARAALRSRSRGLAFVTLTPDRALEAKRSEATADADQAGGREVAALAGAPVCPGGRLPHLV
jgi:Asp-tRNA(Asn)/Glu-tRNA(Gln) amidotransferase A subunit family amidase